MHEVFNILETSWRVVIVKYHHPRLVPVLQSLFNKFDLRWYIIESPLERRVESGGDNFNVPSCSGLGSGIDPENSAAIWLTPSAEFECNLSFALAAHGMKN